MEDLYYQLSQQDLFSFRTVNFIWRSNFENNKVYADEILNLICDYSEEQNEWVKGMSKFKIVNDFIFSEEGLGENNKIALKYKDNIWHQTKINKRRKKKLRFPYFQHKKSTFLPLHLTTQLNIYFEN